MDKRFLGKSLFKVGVSSLLIFAILSKINWDEFAGNVKSINAALYAVAFLLTFADTSLRAYRWKLLLHAKGIDISFGQSLSFTFVGMFFGMFLPTNFGGDIAKMYDFSKYSSRAVDTVSSVFMERWSGIVSLSFISAFSVLVSQGVVGFQISTFSIVFLAAVVAGSFFVFNQRFHEQVFSLFSPRGRFFLSAKEKLEGLFASIRGYKYHKTLFVGNLLIAFLLNILRVVVNFFNSQASGFNVPLVYFFIFIPITILIMMVPVSISGIGIREGAYLYLFSQAGLTSTDAVLLSWMGFVLVISQAVAGGIIFAFRRHLPAGAGTGL
ncbi:MAG: flippase-like domain-containing protein [Nitrospirae bacterium]|nr:flippase-like domain-containing protein [Nitrospirota bacterium]